MWDMVDPRSGDSMTEEEVTDIWTRFKSGAAVNCAACGDLMAVNVDSGTSSYRLVCVGCGYSSPWFSANLQGLKIRGRSSRPPGGRGTRQDI